MPQRTLISDPDRKEKNDCRTRHPLDLAPLSKILVPGVTLVLTRVWCVRVLANPLCHPWTQTMGKNGQDWRVLCLYPRLARFPADCCVICCCFFLVSAVIAFEFCVAQLHVLGRARTEFLSTIFLLFCWCPTQTHVSFPWPGPLSIKAGPASSPWRIPSFSSLPARPLFFRPPPSSGPAHTRPCSSVHRFLLPALSLSRRSPASTTTLAMDNNEKGHAPDYNEDEARLATVSTN